MNTGKTAKPRPRGCVKHALRRIAAEHLSSRHHGNHCASSRKLRNSGVSAQPCRKRAFAGHHLRQHCRDRARSTAKRAKGGSPSSRSIGISSHNPGSCRPSRPLPGSLRKARPNHPHRGCPDSRHSTSPRRHPANRQLGRLPNARHQGPSSTSLSPSLTLRDAAGQ